MMKAIVFLDILHNRAVLTISNNPDNDTSIRIIFKLFSLQFNF
jgi:hypothetical protein